VIVVEHDEETIRSSVWLIDLGPAAGAHGGEVLFRGPASDFLNEPRPGSRTYAFLSGAERIDIPLQRRIGTGKQLTVRGVSFRLGAMNVVTGVSGTGKSTLVHDILAAAKPGIDKVIEIDQTPIGRTPRSNPATYTQLFDHIRDLFAALPEAKERKWGKGRFSFNVKGGRCEACEGAGVQQIGMRFLGNVDVVCDECGGKRFNDETLEIRYNGKNIYEILEMPVEEAAVFFKEHPKISRYLRALLELGMGYITLGQPATTFSGGEAQRIKLASVTKPCRP
jgi:excinuclease ABC subunit A